ncbi:MAG TPA: hypothetical protein VER96_38250 [Polyangiaceae bacterium]|nr:hypothetical protein [Polyangiaceae bacterium]
MIKLASFKFVLVSSLAVVLPSLVACSGNAPSSGETAASGTLSLPLIASANGHSYRLSNAYVYVYGPQYAGLYSSSNPDEQVLSTSLQTGSYTAYLQNWTLERDDGHGRFVPVQASLVSNYWVPFTIFNGTTSTVSYQFSTDGVIVTVGSGKLSVAVEVTEHPAVCTPFTDDCGEGSWCPPTGLTGNPRACMSAGPIALGESCSSPSSCVANSSCFDLGAGPKCIELCPLENVGSECSGGGTCQESGPDYGICGPTAAE